MGRGGRQWRGREAVGEVMQMVEHKYILHWWEALGPEREETGGGRRRGLKVGGRSRETGCLREGWGGIGV